MGVEQFSSKKVSHDKLVMIGQAAKIMREYIAKGLVLTLRQLYYQFVSRDLLENIVENYHKLGKAVSDGRMLGLLDWDAIDDRLRKVVTNLRIDSPKDGVKLLRDQYKIDMWANQPVRVEVWIEKDALSGVIEDVCKEFDVPYLACRGYLSQSAQWRAYRRFRQHREAGQRVVMLHLGDHDPSGVHMTSDNRDRLDWFLRISHHVSTGDKTPLDDTGLEVRRIALTMDQIDEYEPPWNPAKESDSRFKKYEAEYGDKSWELDALEPEVIQDLIREHIESLRDPDLWAAKEKQLAAEHKVLDGVVKRLNRKPKKGKDNANV